EKFDLIIYSTPPMTFSNLIKLFKRRDNSISYLMLKDIFPQNAVDLNIFSKKGAIYNYFRHKEKQTYSISDLIGVMSLANKKYLLNNNNISDGKISIFRNSIYEYTEEYFKDDNLINILNKYEIKKSKTLFIYGGNIGLPQGPH